MRWRPEPTSRATLGDELWVEVKFQSNWVIAGSPRNSYWTSLAMAAGGRALNGVGWRKPTSSNQTPNAGGASHRNYQPTTIQLTTVVCCPLVVVVRSTTLYRQSQTMGAKLHASKGQQPRPQHKVPQSSRLSGESSVPDISQEMSWHGVGSVSKVVSSLGQPGGWLRSSHPLKKA